MRRKLRALVNAEVHRFSDLVAVGVLRLLAQELRNSDKHIEGRLASIEMLQRELLIRVRAS